MQLKVQKNYERNGHYLDGDNKNFWNDDNPLNQDEFFSILSLLLVFWTTYYTNFQILTDKFTRSGHSTKLKIIPSLILNLNLILNLKLLYSLNRIGPIIKFLDQFAVTISVHLSGNHSKILSRIESPGVSGMLYYFILMLLYNAVE